MSRRMNPAMTATLATLPLDIILSISAFLSNPLDALSLSQTCRSAFLASQASASYWSKNLPTAHLPRPAPWHSYSPSELRDAHIRYAATHRRWESPLPTFKRPLRLPPPQSPNGYVDYTQRWRPILGTRWAWSFLYSTGEVNFCDLRSGLAIGKWSARGPVIHAFIESRSPNECVLCHWKTKREDNINEFEIVATSVAFEQENLTSPIKLSFRTIQGLSIERGILLVSDFSRNWIVLWRDYLIGSYIRLRPATGGLFLWDMKENSIFYFEMGFVPRCTKAFDDVLFITLGNSDGIHWHTAFRCIHIPSLVIATQLPGGSLSLTENAFNELLPKSIMESRATESINFVHTNIYSIHDCPPTYPRYCFIIKPFGDQWRGTELEVLEVEIDLSIPGPIKIFSRVSQQYTVQRPTFALQGSDNDLLLYLPLGRRYLPRPSLSVRFLRVGKPDEARVARLRGADKMRLSVLSVDRGAGYVIIWAEENRSQRNHGCSFVWWLDERKAGDTVYSQTKELISSWSRGLLRRF